ncbi:unnamed protein product [Lactuca virosa]|uniref:Bet v I/Major latex protein domain-containing protein n=1 Tax=Lactuca virosa TaxID=75947 RepID=A0AAU9M0U3_9ASTR|nr:unnamed protein product [Lactuca virosa]
MAKIDGKVESAKEMVEEVDDELHKIVFKVIEGGVLEVYNPIILTVNIEDMGHKKLALCCGGRYGCLFSQAAIMKIYMKDQICALYYGERQPLKVDIRLNIALGTRSLSRIDL